MIPPSPTDRALRCGDTPPLAWAANSLGATYASSCGASAFCANAAQEVRWSHIRCSAARMSAETQSEAPQALPRKSLAGPVQRIPVRPKQSLGQNFLVDEPTCWRIVDAFATAVAERGDARGVSGEALNFGHDIVEVGPGFAALTQILLQRYPNMLAIELDQRAVAYLNENFPHLQVVREDVLDVSWKSLAQRRLTSADSKFCVIGNLPYYIVSQILLSLIESHGNIELACLMMQREVAQRVTAKAGSKQYGILSVMCQLYSIPELLFDIPSDAFRPRPKVTSSMVLLRFQKHPRVSEVHPAHLREVVRAAFQQRRKQLRNSLRNLVASNAADAISEELAVSRPEQLEPTVFIDITAHIFGKQMDSTCSESADGAAEHGVWRTRKKKARSAEHTEAISENALG